MIVFVFHRIVCLRLTPIISIYMKANFRTIVNHQNYRIFNIGQSHYVTVPTSLTGAIFHVNEIRSFIARIVDEILRKNSNHAALAVIGIKTRGAILAERIARGIRETAGITVPLGFLDITLYRDDLGATLHQPILQGSEIDFDVTGKDIILVDDVLFTGRTVRAALDELADMGRSASIQLTVLVDRGLRELPIQADFTGTSIVTTRDQEIKVYVSEVDGEDAILIRNVGDRPQ